MRTFIGAAAALAFTLLAGTASAQTCLGRASYADAPWQVRAGSSFSSDSRTFGTSLFRGSASVFGGASLDMTGYSNIEETAVAFGGTIGAERQFETRLYLCPVVTLLHQVGPNVSGNTLSANVASFGGRIGVVAAENQTLQVIPMIGMDAQWEHDSLTQGTDTATGSRTFTVARLGVGFVLNKKTSLVPEIIELFGVAGNTTFRFTATFGFGK